MFIAEVFLVFALAWWVVFLILLPLNFERQTRVLPGNDESAPGKVYVKKIAIRCTWITSLLTVAYVAFTSLS